MKLVQYSIHNRRRYGIIKENTGIIDLFLRLGDRYPTLKSLLENNALPEAATFRYDNPDHDIQAIPFLPVIDEPGKIICAGMNYAEKRKEFNEINHPPYLFVFRILRSVIIRHCSNPITCEFDYEGELAVVIGRRCSHVSEEQALSFVAGYSCYMDGSVRDWQHTLVYSREKLAINGALVLGLLRQMKSRNHKIYSLLPD
jgi:2-keto-4-pentenoate hydratase/2-oxohepta-3-ene-1,7-dioic acid hydratase in catechol pathway